MAGDDLTDLPGLARAIAATIVAAVQREYPNQAHHTMTGPDDRPAPHEIHPAFYGCFDWHSAVHMHWSLVRLLRVAGDALPAGAVRAVLDRHLTAEGLAVEGAYLAEHRGFERPYGWGWALALAHELAGWSDPDATRWAGHIAGLADTVAGLYLRWLPRATYPVRAGTHGNSAFGLALAIPYARARADDGDAGLLDAIVTAARRWYGGDVGYPAGWEPGGADFLSPALTEAVLMAEVLPEADFGPWCDAFLPGLAGGEPASLFTPAIVADPTDGQTAHLHGLNLYRAYAFRRLAAAPPGGDARREPMLSASRRHAAASLGAVSGQDYAVEHWLASYAVLLLT